MRIEEASRRIDTTMRTMVPKTEEEAKNQEALHVATVELQRALCDQRKKSQEKQKKDITISELDIMADMANKKQVEIELTIDPDQQNVTVRPWKPTRTNWESEADDVTNT